MAMVINGKVDLNEFAKQAGSAAKGLDAGTALLYNASGSSVQFYCYNGGDFIQAIAYSKPTIAPGYAGTIAAGGSNFKVFANNKGDAEFLVKPGKAYIFHDKGAVEEVTN